MSKPKIKLDDLSLKQLIKAFKEIDDITDFLQSIYGDDWGELNKLGSVWYELHELIEYHVGEGNVVSAMESND